MNKLHEGQVACNFLSEDLFKNHAKDSPHWFTIEKIPEEMNKKYLSGPHKRESYKNSIYFVYCTMGIFDGVKRWLEVGRHNPRVKRSKARIDFLEYPEILQLRKDWNALLSQFNHYDLKQMSTSVAKRDRILLTRVARLLADIDNIMSKKESYPAAVQESLHIMAKNYRKYLHNFKKIPFVREYKGSQKRFDQQFRTYCKTGRDSSIVALDDIRVVYKKEKINQAQLSRKTSVARRKIERFIKNLRKSVVRNQAYLDHKQYDEMHALFQENHRNWMNQMDSIERALGVTVKTGNYDNVEALIRNL